MVPSGQVLMIQDFAVNRKSMFHAEAKAAFYGKHQMALHPTVCFYKNAEGEQVRHTVMHMSDYLCRDYHMVDFLTRSVMDILAKETTIKEAIVWSDGCGYQYKCRGNFADIANQKKIERDYFGSEHGKGESDGETGRFAKALLRAVSGGRNFKKAADMVAFGNETAQSTNTALKKRTFMEFFKKDYSTDRPETEVKPGKAAQQLKTRHMSCFCTGCTTEKYDCCVNKQYVSPPQDVTLKKCKPAAAPVAVIEPQQEDEAEDEAEDELTLTNQVIPTIGQWIELRGLLKSKKAVKEDFWYCCVTRPPVNTPGKPLPGGGGFWIQFCERNVAGIYSKNDKLEQIPIDSNEEYHWRVIEDPIYQQKGSRGYYIFK